MVLYIAVRGGGGGTARLSTSLQHLQASRSWFLPPQNMIQRFTHIQPPLCCRQSSSSTTTTSTIGTAVNNTPTSSHTNPEKNAHHHPTRRLSVAIVGAGPSGFYTAKYLSSAVVKKLQSAAAIILASTSSSSTAADDVATAADDGEAAGLPTNFFNYRGIDIDILERLPTPYGLVRYGVAPDHPEVKNVEKEFASLFVEPCSSVGGETTTIPSSSSIIANKLIAHNSISTLSYFGNVDVGHTISLSQLQSLYDIVVLAYGCQSSDKRLGIPGEAELEGVLSAREFVAWYNGHPEFGHIGHIVHRCLWPKSLSDEGAKDGNNSSSCSCSSSSGTEVSKARVVVIGQGNVALDVARILSKGTAGLIDTDTPTSVLKILKGGVSHVSIVGRRGHVQGAFTIKEVRELTKLYDEGFGVAFLVRKEELEMGMTESSVSELTGTAGRPKTRLVKLLQEAAESTNDNCEFVLLRRLFTSNEHACIDFAMSASNISKAASKEVELRFLMNPLRFEPDYLIKDRVGRVVCERTKLVGGPFHQQPIGTSETEIIPADLILVSIGYRGMPLEGMKELQIFDDKKGVVKNVQGKVTGNNNLFVTGWIKRGPLGIIGTNIMDAKETVASIIECIESGELNAQQAEDSKVSTGRSGLTEFLGREGVEFISWPKFMKIDAAECDRTRLRSDAQPREKFISTDGLLKIASQSD